MKSKLIIIISVITMLLSLISSLSASAYTTASNLFVRRMEGSYSFSCNSNGILLYLRYFKSNYDPSVLMSGSHRLDTSFFQSGTWQGQDVSELSSKLIFDQSDTTGFSQITSYTDEGNYFVYQVMTCIPYVAGDSFTILLDEPSSYVSACNYYTQFSMIDGGTGIKQVYNKSASSHTSEPLTYTTKSENQYLVTLYCPDLFRRTSGNALSASNADKVGSDYVNLSRIGSDVWFSMYTNTYGLSKGSDISVNLLPDVDNFAFTVYEIYTDGTTNPGEDKGESDEGDSGSGGSADLSGVEKLLNEILSVLKESSQPVFTPEDFWAVYKSGLEEMFGIEEKQPEEPPPESSDVTDPAETTEKSPFEIDEEEFSSAMEYVDPDQLGESISGPSGAIYFFWRFTDQFFDTFHLHTIVAISLFFCFILWLLRR